MSIFVSSKCRLFHNATLFGFCITHILNTGCAKIWKKIRRQKVKTHWTIDLCLQDSTIGIKDIPMVVIEVLPIFLLSLFIQMKIRKLFKIHSIFFLHPVLQFFITVKSSSTFIKCNISAERLDALTSNMIRVETKTLRHKTIS